MVNKIKLFKTIFFAIAGNGFFYFEFTYSGLESNITADEEFGTAEFNDPQLAMMMIPGFLRKKALKNFLMKNSDSDSIGIKRNGQFCVFDDQNKDDQNIIYKIDIKNDNTIYARYDSKWQELNLNEKHHFLFNL